MSVCLLSPGSWLVFVVPADAHMLSTETFPLSSASLEALPKIFVETAAFPCLSFENILFLPFPTLPQLRLSYLSIPEAAAWCSCLVCPPLLPLKLIQPTVFMLLLPAQTSSVPCLLCLLHHSCKIYSALSSAVPLNLPSLLLCVSPAG